MPTPSVYWDACVVSALLGREHNRVEGCKLIERDARQGLTIIYTSAITFTECIRVSSTRERLTQAHEQAIQRYFMHKFIRVVDCNRGIGEHARWLIWRNMHLQPHDAIHVASALAAQVDIMYTYDNGDLVRLDRQIGTPPLRIENPPQ